MLARPRWRRSLRTCALRPRSMEEWVSFSQMLSRLPKPLFDQCISTYIARVRKERAECVGARHHVLVRAGRHLTMLARVSAAE